MRTVTRLSLSIGGLLFIGGAALSGWWFTRASSDELLHDARRALTDGDLSRAEELAGRVLARRPDSVSARLLSGEAAQKRGDYPAALRHYRAVPPEAGEKYVIAMFTSGEIHLHENRIAAAERAFRRVLELEPEHYWAHSRLAALLGLTDRGREAVSHLLHLVQQRRFSTRQLVLLGSADSIIDAEEALQKARQNEPDAVTPLMGLARIAQRQQEWKRAEELLQEALARDPNELKARARLGEVLVQRRESEQQFLAWNASLPAAAERYPGVWVARGEWASLHGAAEVAIRCFWEAVRRAPNHRYAVYQLGQLLQQNEPSKASPFVDRADKLQRLDETLVGLYRHREYVPGMRQAAELTESLGRLWESWGWCYVALAVQPRLSWPRQRIERLQGQLRSDLPRTLASANPARQVDLSSFPLPRWRTSGHDPVPCDVASTETAVRFRNVAEAAGLSFQYHNASNPRVKGSRMYEFTGGAVAVLDFDGDAWPDLYFSQGSDWPPEPHQSIYYNRLFRNLGNGRFREVTSSAGCGDNGFGQGVSVGDFDSDGFPDLYVANIGMNRLYRNNGDGTFSQMTHSFPGADSRWTTSCLLADLDGDGLADIYDVNYLTGDDVFKKVCEQEGHPTACSPKIFPAERDQVWVNDGDGRFRDMTESSGVAVPDGKGLGIVAADFDQSGRLSLFIANDMVPNFYFRNVTSADEGGLRFLEQGIVSGLALSHEGMAEACMGVALGDANVDGKFDLFVTNFYEETNTLYQQHSAKYFVDITRSAGLSQPGFRLLGFGTQFLDANLDGAPDLVATNGHVGRYPGAPYRMPALFLLNRGDGRFRRVPNASIGPYFERDRLGRGLARLDWDRDGKEDFAVSHLDAPAALLTNATEPAGHSLAVALRGVRSHRDAIGSTVKVQVGDRWRTQQLAAGDGYHASNQRQLVFGLGEAQAVQKLEVRWPSGGTQTFENLPADVEVLLIEGRSTAMLLPEPSTNSKGKRLGKTDGNGPHSVAAVLGGGRRFVTTVEQHKGRPLQK